MIINPALLIDPSMLPRDHLQYAALLTVLVVQAGGKITISHKELEKIAQSHPNLSITKGLRHTVIQIKGDTP